MGASEARPVILFILPECCVWLVYNETPVGLLSTRRNHSNEWRPCDFRQQISLELQYHKAVVLVWEKACSLLQGVESQTPARGARQLTSLARGSHCVHSDSARSPNYYAAEQAAERLAAWKEFIV